MDSSIINLKDEFGNDLQGKVLNILEIDGIEYLLYSVSINDEEDALYVKKIIRDANGEDDLIDIVDEEEKNKVKTVVNDYVEQMSGE